MKSKRISRESLRIRKIIAKYRHKIRAKSKIIMRKQAQHHDKCELSEEDVMLPSALASQLNFSRKAGGPDGTN